MNEKQYLDALSDQLKKLNEKERADIRRDFEEYFESGRQEGKSTEEIIAGLGSPEDIAKDLLSAYSEEDFVEEISLPTEVVHAPYSKIKAKVKNVNLIVMPTDREEAYLEVKDQDDRTTTSLEIKDDTLYVKAERTDVVKKFLFITFVGNFGNSEVTLYLPKIHLQEVKIDNDDGKIIVSDLEAEAFHLDSDNGRIVIENIKSTFVKARSSNGRIIVNHSTIETLNAASSNGKIIADHVKSEQIKLKSANGRIELTEVTGAIDATSSNGRIEANISKITANSSFVSGNGSIKVLSPKPLENVHIDMKTNWGSTTAYGQSTTEYFHGDGTVKLLLMSGNGKVLVDLQELETK